MGPPALLVRSAWTESPTLIDPVVDQFNALWEGRHCAACRRKDVCPVPLEEPALYLTPEAAAQAQRLGVELEAARADLDAAFAEWEAATRVMEAID